MGTLRASSAIAATLSLAVVACGSEETGRGGAGGVGSGDGGAGGTGQGASGQGPSSTGNSVVATTGTGGAMAFACDPPAPPGSLYELSAPAFDPTILEPISMCQYRGDVLLVVNTAAL